MALQEANSFAQGAKDEVEYLPVSVASLRQDTTIEFDLYLRTGPSEPAVLYTQKNSPFSKEAFKRLDENKISSLYIPALQAEEYHQYIEVHLKDMVLDNSLGPEAKSEVLYSSSNRLVKGFYENPKMKKGVDRTRNVAVSTIEFISSEKTALRHMIRSAAVDFHLFTHSVNVCSYGIGLAQRAGLDHPDTLREFAIALLLQDMGMNNLDPAIRDNTENLNVAQTRHMKEHTRIGEAALARLGGLSDTALDVVRHHHEKLDGKGYPDGLKGNQISTLVRISSIVDVFDALTSNRPHRKAYSSFEAIQMMNTTMKKDFDLEILRSFISMMGDPDRVLSQEG